MSPKMQVEVSVLDRMSAHVKQMNDSMTNFAKNTERGLGAMTKGFGALGAVVGAGVIINKITGIMNASLNMAEAIEKTSQAYGISTRAVQEWNYAATQVKATPEAIHKAFGTFSKNIVDYSRGIGLAKESFKSLGFSVKDTAGNMKSSEALFKEMILTLSDIENPVLRAAEAQNVFGKAGKELAPLLSSGRTEIEKLLGEADRLGQVLDQRTIASLNKAKDQMGTFKTATSVLGAELTNIFAPALGVASVAVAKFLRSLRGDEKDQEEVKQGIIKQYQDDLTVLTAKLKDLEAVGAKDNDWFMWKDGMITIEQAKKNIQSLKVRLDELNKVPPIDITPKAGKETKLPDNFWSLGVDKAIQGSKTFQQFINDNMFLASMQGDILAKFSVDNLAPSLAVVEENAKFRQSVQQEIDKALLDSTKTYGQMEFDYVDTKYAALIEKAQAAGISIINIEKAIANEKDRLNKAAIANSLSYTTNSLREIAGKWHEFSLLYKGFAIAQTTWDTYSAATSAYKSMAGIPVVGPALGTVAAAAAIGMGLKNVAEISKMNPRNMASGSGNSYVAPGMYRLGEHGPENAYLASPARIYNNTETRHMETINSGSSVTVNVLGSNGRVVETLRASMRSGEGRRLARDLVRVAQGR